MIDIVAVTYNQNENLKCFINSIKCQTSDKWRLFIIHDGLNANLEEELRVQNYLNDKITFIQHPSRTQNYGHLLRKWGVENIESNGYLLLTNGDNYYTPNMVEEVLKRREDLIYFDLIHSHDTPVNQNRSTYGFMNSKLFCSYVDIGNVVIKSQISKKVGFNSINYAADWDYIESVLKLNPSVYKINKVLFVHN
jgi:hypothetical protein